MCNQERMYADQVNNLSSRLQMLQQSVQSLQREIQQLPASDSVQLGSQPTLMTPLPGIYQQPTYPPDPSPSFSTQSTRTPMPSQGIKDVIHPDFTTVEESDTLEQIISAMTAVDGAEVVVMGGDQPVGVITAYDLVANLQQGEDTEAPTAEELMKGVAITTENASIAGLVEDLQSGAGRTAVVLGDEDNQPIGTVSLDELVRLLAAELYELTKATEMEDGEQ